MPLPKPALDNRHFDQLVAEGRGMLPRRASFWTEYNASDHGIALLELGSWLAEQNFYRFDRLPDEAVRAFARLVGVEPRGPSAAATVVAINHTDAAPLLCPAGTQLADDEAARFETVAPLWSAPARLTRILTGRGTLSEIDIARMDAGFAPFGIGPRPGSALYLGFDLPLDAPGATWSLHVWTPNWREDAAAREALVAEWGVRHETRPAHCPPLPDWRQHYRVETVWEFHAGGGVWRPLQDVVDETRALTLSGFVRFAAPTGHQPDEPAGRFFIRSRIRRGRFECPPILVHVAFNAVACIHALSRPEREIGQSRGHAGTTFKLDDAPILPESLRLRLEGPTGPLPGEWKPVQDWDRSGPHDQVVLVRPERGEIVGPDGYRGAVLPAGARLFASWRQGGGVEGNIAAGRLTLVPENPHNLALAPGLAALAKPPAVSQPFAATGGAARETLASLRARTFDRTSEVDKAATLEDVERLALAAPGLPVARVRAVANLSPRLPCYPAPGIITLAVIPRCPARAPMPSRALLDAVERHLELRRLVTSEIRAVAPRYRRVGVAATLHLGCATDLSPQAVFEHAAGSIAAFFDPFHGGPDGEGWPFGRPVYRTEIMALLAETPGVTRVTDLSFLTGSRLARTADGTRCACEAEASGCACGHAGHGPRDCGCGSPAGGRCDNVILCAHELVVPGRHHLRLQADTPQNLSRSRAHECPDAA